MKVNWIYVAIIGFILFCIVLYFVYRQGKKSAEAPKVTYQYPNGQGLPAGWSPLTLVDKLYNTMNGWFLPNPIDRDNAWLELAKLNTPDMVRNVYDVFNQIHFKEGKGTLTQWINDESILGWPGTAKNAALTTLTSLKLI
jgi:hypothetical protein